ncbi:MAG: purine-nucleoside phosphorylase [Candidatus Eisenbacteria bacterium]|uniref:purine-nucleoside phosphorylase n=1 Tax=Eiseniibacteriota bacterium TaxID=2212470 RepID=A0A538T3R6_UNCEI|nr:MAG: purine-nucleoside phosphorylase [Candidatus Eisenbacteria bacterium]
MRARRTVGIRAGDPDGGGARPLAHASPLCSGRGAGWDRSGCRAVRAGARVRDPLLPPRAPGIGVTAIASGSGRLVTRAPALDPEEALQVIRRRTTLVPKVALVLGSGLGILAEGVAWEATLSTEEIPGLPRSTVAGHSSRLLFGRWSGRAVVVAQGRAHLYEGYTAEEVTRAVRLFATLGARSLVLTNAAGGIASRMTPGTLMLVEDHVNLQWRAPGRVAGRAAPGATGGARAKPGPGPTAPPNQRGLTSRPVYSRDLLAKAARAAVNAGVRAERGILGVTLGPSYETPAEIAMLERMGADAVCMSTAAEVAAANEIALPVACISCVTNWAAGKSPVRLKHEDVTAGVAAAAPALRSVIERLILSLA